jgi:carboxyl-terminal processing protease
MVRVSVRGKVILLGDEQTQSHAEFTMMALKTAPDVTIVGSPTAGADGNVSLIALPGGLRTAQGPRTHVTDFLYSRPS